MPDRPKKHGDSTVLVPPARRNPPAAAGQPPRRLYDRLLKMLREEHAPAEDLSIERAHLAAELEVQRIGRRGREEIFQARIQQVGGDRPWGSSSSSALRSR